MSSIAPDPERPSRGRLSGVLAGLLLVAGGALGCGSTGGSKPNYWETVGAINHPFVQVTLSGDAQPARTLDLRLEDGKLKVGREVAASADGGCTSDGASTCPAGSTTFDIKEATATQEELDRGRELMTAALLTGYKQASETVRAGVRRARFVVVAPMSNDMITFTSVADAPSAVFADLVTYVGGVLTHYQP